jgi:hypothetical protein
VDLNRPRVSFRLHHHHAPQRQPGQSGFKAFLPSWRETLRMRPAPTKKFAIVTVNDNLLDGSD